MAEASKLDTLRSQHQHILDYERQREARRGRRPVRELRPQLDTLKRHLAQWAQASAGSGEESPLAPLAAEWAEAAGVAPAQPVEADPPPARPRPRSQGKGKGKTKAKAKAPAKAPAASPPEPDNPPQSGAAPQPGAAAPTPPAHEAGEEGGETDDGDGVPDRILGKGDWLKAHARIVSEEIPKVKSAAADPAQYLAAKRDFLKRNLPKVREYELSPKKAHSPLFAYCVLFLSDVGHTADALALASKAIELGQSSPIKRNFHELLFDVRLAELEALAPEASKAGKGKTFDALTALRDQLMSDPFRGNHAKAKVCKTYAQACMAVGDYETAKQNLLEIKFLNPAMGVETLLGQCAEKLDG